MGCQDVLSKAMQSCDLLHFPLEDSRATNNLNTKPLSPRVCYQVSHCSVGPTWHIYQCWYELCNMSKGKIVPYPYLFIYYRLFVTVADALTRRAHRNEPTPDAANTTNPKSCWQSVSRSKGGLGEKMQNDSFSQQPVSILSFCSILPSLVVNVVLL